MKEDHEIRCLMLKRGALLKEIKALVEKNYPNDLHQQGLVYYNLNHSHELKEWEIKNKKTR